jgi:hypothetical protein
VYKGTPSALRSERYNHTTFTFHASIRQLFLFLVRYSSTSSLSIFLFNTSIEAGLTMHTTLAVIFSTLFLTSSTCARVVPPQSLYPLSRRALSTSLSSTEDKCTFTLFHKQVQEVNYVQLNTLIDHTNDITIDLAHLRPRTEHNSYAKVSAKQAFAVEGLLNNANLTIRAEDGRDALRFESDGLIWTSESGSSSGKAAWCETAEWVEGGKGSRVCWTLCVV